MKNCKECLEEHNNPSPQGTHSQKSVNHPPCAGCIVAMSLTGRDTWRRRESAKKER